jgi:uncharacterized membrane protein YphA (DoxX/SURF4 family)
MSLSAKLRRAPLRLVTGAFVLNAGVGKLSADEETAKALHGMASGTYGFLGKMDPKTFAKVLAVGEITVGSALLLPIVSPVIAGGALLGFSGGLLNLYWHTPGMHEDGDPRPTQQGTAIAKDVWMFGIGAGLVADGLLEPAHDKKVEIGATVAAKRAARGRNARKARKARKKAAKANRALVASAVSSVQELQSEAGKRAKKASKKASKKDKEVSGQPGSRLDGARAEYGPVVAAKAKQAREAAKGYVGEYGPVVAEKAKQAREAAKEYVDEYGPVVAEKAKAARVAAAGLVDEYGPVVADKISDGAKQARDVAQDTAGRAKAAAAR